MKRPPARWITEAIKKTKNEKKYILRHEYKSIAEKTVQLQKEKESKQQKMVVCNPIQKLKMQHYHEALKNARANPKETRNLQKRRVPGKSKQNKCNFENPTISASTFNYYYYYYYYY